MKFKAALLMWVVVSGLAGCAGAGPSGTLARTFDLGTSVPAVQLTAARLGLVRAVEPFDSLDMAYRLAYRDAGEISAFTQSRWAAPPAVMLRTRLARAAAPVTGAHCTLDLEVLEFSQLFDTRDTSQVMIEVRAVLSDAAARLQARSFRVVEGSAGSTASSGSAAMSRAADKLIGELAAWSSQQPVCRP